MHIVLLHFASDIIPSAEVAVLSVSLAILVELKHKTKVTAVLLLLKQEHFYNNCRNSCVLIG